MIATTAVLAIPLGVAAAVQLEEFADKTKRVNHLIEVNVQNLAAIPSVVYGLLALAVLTLVGVQNKNLVIAGATALRPAHPAGDHHRHPGGAAIGACRDPRRIAGPRRHAAADDVATDLPSAVPGIATGAILALSRALGEAAPLLLLGVGVRQLRPERTADGYTTLPIQIFNWTGRPQEEFRVLAPAASIVLLVLLLAMNGLAIYIRNHFQRRW